MLGNTRSVSFAHDRKIMVATDAAGEGINLQFCRYLINWDIPWNPNRLEQRMGRIHRYGQQDDVWVYNLVAQNTREGAVLQKILIQARRDARPVGLRQSVRCYRRSVGRCAALQLD